MMVELSPGLEHLLSLSPSFDWMACFSLDPSFFCTLLVFLPKVLSKNVLISLPVQFVEVMRMMIVDEFGMTLRNDIAQVNDRACMRSEIQDGRLGGNFAVSLLFCWRTLVGTG